MMVFKNVSLSKYNTFRLSYTADSLILVQTEKQAEELFGGQKWKNPYFIIGGGSNILFTDDFHGTIVIPEMRDIEILPAEDSDHILVSAGAGLEWDNFVEFTVSKGYTGLENLSLIPGKVGATPVQNIGAYGVEVKDSIESVRTIETSSGIVRNFSNNECDFGYRNSFFKNKGKGKYMVTRVVFRLSLIPKMNLSYGMLRDEMSNLGESSIKNLRQAVINIRRSKLPDPELIGNAGSFFKNPVVPAGLGTGIKKDFPNLPMYDDRDGFVKLAAGWLIEQCGWKGKRFGNAGVHDKQALVLVNQGNASGKDIYYLSEEIKASVKLKFGIELEREVEIVGPI